MSVADRLVAIAPGWQSGIDVVFIGMDQPAGRNCLGDNRLAARWAAYAGSPVRRAGSARERVVSPVPACRVPAHLKACDAVPAAPFYHLSRLALVPSHDGDFIDRSGALQLRDGSACHQPLAEVLGHRLHVRGVQAQFLRDLPVGEVQPHQVEAQNPHAQWLMVPAQHRAGQIVEASMARLAQVALPVPLAFVMAIADDHGIVAVRAAHASWPTMLTHKLKTLGLVQQPREIDPLRSRHACAASKTTRSRLHPIRSETWLQRYPSRATTPEPNKSLKKYQRSLKLMVTSTQLPGSSGLPVVAGGCGGGPDEPHRRQHNGGSHSRVMAAPVPATHDWRCWTRQRRGWPGQARP